MSNSTVVTNEQKNTNKRQTNAKKKKAGVNVSARMSQYKHLASEKERVEQSENKRGFDIKDIDRTKIVPNEKNFYDLNNIEELAEDIDNNGLNHNLVVNDLGNGTYRIISGHRRFEATALLENKGRTRFDELPCKVVKVDEITEHIMMIQLNATTRVITEAERRRQVKELTELYREKKKRGEKIPGRLRSLIANGLEISDTQAGRYMRINEKLLPELQHAFDRGKLSLVNASEFATLSPENQLVVAYVLMQNEELTVPEGRELKKALNELSQEKEEKVASVVQVVAKKTGTDVETAVTIPDTKAEVERVEEEYKEKLNDITSRFVHENDEVAKNRKRLNNLNNTVMKTMNAMKEISPHKDNCLEELHDLLQNLLQLSKKVEELIDEKKAVTE